MTKCSIQFTHVSTDNYGGSKAVGRCLTHNFPMPDAPITTDEKCPIGQIEEATEEALTRIKARVSETQKN